MILRVLSGSVGLAILGAVAHVTVLASGGYGDSHAVLVLAIAAGVGVGSLAIGTAWADRRFVITCGIGVALICGEAFGLVQTSERLIASREAAQAPLRQVIAKKQAARRSVENAQAALAALARSQRLDAALAAKADADRAAVEKAALRGCALNCRKLLEQQIEMTAAEVSAARTALDARRDLAAARLRDVMAALASIKLPRSATGLADRLHVPAWRLDLLAAALGSIGSNILGAMLLAFAAHRPRAGRPLRVDTRAVGVEAGTATANASAPHDIANEQEHIAQFALNRLRAAPGQQLGIGAIYSAYRNWCHAENLAPLPVRQAGTLFADLFNHMGQSFAEVDGVPVVLDVAIDGPAPAKELITAA